MMELPFRPYKDESRDFLYNLLFCDDRELFRPKEGEPAGALAEVLADAAPAKTLRRIATDEDEESRVRALAFNRLHERGELVPAHVVLGTVVEVAMAEGLDALAAYADGRVRYLNHAAAPALFETAPEPVAEKARSVLAASEPIVRRIGPWSKPRLSPPEHNRCRLTFVVSDGLYFGEGPFGALASDPLSAPLIRAAGALLGAVADAVLRQ